MADQTITVNDAGTTQQEAVGMGAVYDSARDDPVNITASVPVADTAVGIDLIAQLLASLLLTDTGGGSEVVSITATLAQILDSGAGSDTVGLTADVVVIDSGAGNEVVLISATIPITDSGSGTDVPTAGKAYFYVDANNVLHPLGVIVLRGKGREDLLPGTRENVEKVPGRHGEIDFGSEFEPRIFELRVDKSMDPATREQLKRTFAKWLNPLKGAKPLIYADDVEKTYQVKYAGKIDPEQYPNFLEFTIPFKAGDPFIIGTFEKSHTGSGVLTNEGTHETPVVITIQGPVTNPSVQVSGSTLTYTGSLADGDTLAIDTGTMTVKFNGVNAVASYSGGYPKLQPGDTVVMAAAAGTTTFKWRDRWI